MLSRVKQTLKSLQHFTANAIKNLKTCELKLLRLAVQIYSQELKPLKVPAQALLKLTAMQNLALLRAMKQSRNSLTEAVKKNDAKSICS